MTPTASSATSECDARTWGSSTRLSGLGGWRGALGVLLVAAALGLAFGSLSATILGQWFPAANTPAGIALLTLATGLLILIWLWGGVMR